MFKKRIAELFPSNTRFNYPFSKADFYSGEKLLQPALFIDGRCTHLGRLDPYSYKTKWISLRICIWLNNIHKLVKNIFSFRKKPLLNNYIDAALFAYHITFLHELFHNVFREFDEIRVRAIIDAYVRYIRIYGD